MNEKIDATIASRLRGAFPSYIAKDVNAVAAVVPTITISPAATDIGPILIDGESVHLPSRIYNAEPCTIDTLTPRQRTVFSCLYSRHHDGHIRERHVLNVLTCSESWVPPFVVQLIGEYVIEVVERIKNHLPQLDRQAYESFVAQNPRFCHLTAQRVISYWSCYYRSSRIRFIDHTCYQVARDLEIWNSCPNEGRRLIRVQD